MTTDFPDWVWAVGEESSDPVVARGGERHRVDELACSQHLEHQDGDLAAVAGLGVRVVRYPMPWRLTEAVPGAYDWSYWDRALARCERHRLVPIVDLCHFGLPDHLAGFCHRAWVDAFLRYVDAFLARYREPVWFTPVNESLTTAVMSARLGVWNDRRRSAHDYAVALSLCALANLEAHARITADRDGWTIGAEAIAIVPQPIRDDRAARRVALDRATWDLHLGFPLDPIAEPVFASVPDDMRARVDALATTHHVVAGHDFYPVSAIGDGLTIGERVDAYARWARAWHGRYGVPFWIAETSNLGLPVDAQTAWLDTLAGRLAELRADGLPVHGLCWYSRGDQFDWQTALVEPTGALTEVGLFTHERVARPSAEAFARLVTSTPA